MTMAEFLRLRVPKEAIALKHVLVQEKFSGLNIVKEVYLS